MAKTKAYWVCCEIRTTVMVIAALTLLRSILESSSIFMVGGNNGVVSKGSPFFYAIVSSGVLMAIFSILLFIGAFKQRWIDWMCLPWLVLSVIQLLYQLYILIMLIVLIIPAFNMAQLGAFLVVLLVFLVLLWMINVVYVFWSDTRGGASAAKDEEDPLISK